MKYVKTQLIQNRRLITGTAMAMAASVVYLAAGYLGGTVWSWGWMDLTAAGMLVSMVTLWGFGFWTVKSLPKYPTTKLEHQQVAIERAVLSEWGEAIGYLRLTIEKCEECSDRVIQHHRVRLMDDHVEPNLLQTLLIGMHAKACDLARVVADDCQRGHAEAAFATWRAIFEIQVNMAFIAADTTGETAKRFQDWSKASALRLYDPESDELKTLRKTYAGWEIDRDMGWTRKGYLMGYSNPSPSDRLFGQPGSGRDLYSTDIPSEQRVRAQRCYGYISRFGHEPSFRQRTIGSRPRYAVVPNVSVPSQQ